MDRYKMTGVEVYVHDSRMWKAIAEQMEIVASLSEFMTPEGVCSSLERFHEWKRDGDAVYTGIGDPLDESVIIKIQPEHGIHFKFTIEHSYLESA